MSKKLAVAKTKPAEQARFASLLIDAIEAAKANVTREKAKTYQQGISLDAAKAKLLKLIENSNEKPVVIKNPRTGEKARLNRKSIGKLLSNKTVGKSTANGFTEYQHFAVAADIDNLFRNATKVITHQDNKKRRSIEAIHRFVAPLFENNAAFITIRETTEYGNKIYSVELIELGKLEGKLLDVESNSSSNPATSFPVSNIQK